MRFYHFPDDSLFSALCRAEAIMADYEREEILDGEHYKLDLMNFKWLRGENERLMLLTQASIDNDDRVLFHEALKARYAGIGEKYIAQSVIGDIEAALHHNEDLSPDAIY